MQIGKTQILTVSRHAEAGVYLKDEAGVEVLLPNRYVPEVCKVGDEISVFVYTDGEDRPIAATVKPFAEIGQFALMTVKQVTDFGAFLEWGVMKDLLLPFSEQRGDLNNGDKVFVYVYEDSVTHRVVASARWDKFINPDVSALKRGQKVELTIASKSDLGYKVVIDSTYKGLIFNSDVCRPITIGDKMEGYIYKVRDDGKVDVRLKSEGYESISGEADKILAKLKAEGGFIAVTDKSSPELINELFGMSKKTYKKAVGDLYKRHIVALYYNGLKLLNA